FLVVIDRSPKRVLVGAAGTRLVKVERRICKVIDVQRNAITEHDHQQDRPKDRESEADAVVPQLDRLAPGEGPDAREAEAPGFTMLLALGSGDRFRRHLGWRLGRLCRLLLEIADERLLERRSLALLHQLGR